MSDVRSLTVFYVGIPTRNAGSLFKRNQKLFEDLDSLTSGLGVLIFDTESNDGTLEWAAKQPGAHVKQIQKNEFGHGKTRDAMIRYYVGHEGINGVRAEVVVFLTQDALLESAEDVERLVKVFDDPDVAVAYGRQLPHDDASPIAAHARLFNYPDLSRLKAKSDIPVLGIKTVFCSNSFSAYRIKDYLALGGFPTDTILGEDMAFCAKAIQAGKKVYYCAESRCKHSHNYTVKEEFKRYFDTGVFHAKEADLLAQFGSAGGEGLKFIISEFKFLCAKAPWLIPLAFLNTLSKYIGYKLGKNYSKLPLKMRKRFSMHSGYWD